MGSFGQLGKKLHKLSDDLPFTVNNIKKRTAMRVNNDLLLNTDVDTGEAMSNWQIGANNAVDGIRPAFVPSPKGYVSKKGGSSTWTHRTDPEATRQANLPAARQAAGEAIESIQPGESIHITNNTPQIVPLNDGTPDRPGKHFAERAVLIATEALARDNKLLT